MSPIHAVKLYNAGVVCSRCITDQLQDFGNAIGVPWTSIVSFGQLPSTIQPCGLTAIDACTAFVHVLKTCIHENKGLGGLHTHFS